MNREGTRETAYKGEECGTKEIEDETGL